MERRKSHTNNIGKLYIIISVLIILLIGTFGFLGYKLIKENRIERENELLQQGITMGAENVVVDLMNQASACNPVPMSYNNVTLTMFALECPNLAEVANAALQQKATAQTETEE